MTTVNTIWLAHQRKRFMRPDAWRYVRPDVVQRRALQAQDDVATEMDAAAMKAVRAELSELRSVVADFKFRLALRKFGRK